ncbi:CAP domain-containing protein [Candidatus Nomurabacteria bacterium]|nr:CAP domain-containing protein [Candidatus Nomurabacteria bacterium]
MFEDLGPQFKEGNKSWRTKVKDFFIPSIENDYHPHSLQYRRLFFYASSAVAMKVIVAIFVVLLPITAWLTPDVLTGESKKIITLTNQVRVNLNLNPLTESAILDQAAYNKVEDMLLEQYFAHVGPDGKRVSSWLRALGYTYHVAGENLAMGFASAEDVVAAWQNSPTHYANLIDPLYSEIGVSMANGLYNGGDTTLAAQFFAKPRVVVQPITETTEEIKEVTEVKVPESIVPEIKTNDLNNSQIIEAENQPEVLDLPEENFDFVVEENIPDLEIISDSQVLAEQELNQPLLPAKIISPETGFLANFSQIDLEIESVASNKIIVYDNGQVLLDKNKAENLNNFILPLTLTEGEHEIYLLAFKDQEQISSEKYYYQVDLTAPSVDLEKTKIIIDQPEGKNEAIVKIDAYLSEDVETAMVNIGGVFVDLEQNDPGHWLAYTTFSKEQAEKFFNPIILPSLQIIDFAGNQNTVDLSFDQIKPVKTSLLNQYFFLRHNQLDGTKTLFNISLIYYKIFGLLLSIALILNIFVHIKKQNYKVIGSAVLLLLLLGFLIIF